MTNKENDDGMIYQYDELIKKGFIKKLENEINYMSPNPTISYQNELVDKINFLIEEEKKVREHLRYAPSKVFTTGRISGMQEIIKLIETKEK